MKNKLDAEANQGKWREQIKNSYRKTNEIINTHTPCKLEKHNKDKKKYVYIMRRIEEGMVDQGGVKKGF